MIVAETPRGYRFVTQPDHARLAGQFAGQWGGDGFERPAPLPAVAMAAHVHDDGWFARDRRPYRRPDGTPQPFTDLPPAAWIELYDRGIERAVALDRYAGLLVSMHGTGLRRRRYGLSPSWPDTPPAFADFVDRQEARQRELVATLASDPADGRAADADRTLLETLHETGTPPAETASRLWTNYRLLQAWDALSLSVCRTTSPPADDALENVPPGPNDPAVTLSLSALDDGAVGVALDPFAVEPLRATVFARTVEGEAFDTDRDLLEAFHAAELEAVEVTFRPMG
ncbi:MAG: DUF3891 family protein [Halobacteriales archaeon]